MCVDRNRIDAAQWLRMMMMSRRSRSRKRSRGTDAAAAASADSLDIGTLSSSERDARRNINNKLHTEGASKGRAMK